jgi:hypothetical protein
VISESKEREGALDQIVEIPVLCDVNLDLAGVVELAPLLFVMERRLYEVDDLLVILMDENT